MSWFIDSQLEAAMLIRIGRSCGLLRLSAGLLRMSKIAVMKMASQSIPLILVTLKMQKAGLVE